MIAIGGVLRRAGARLGGLRAVARGFTEAKSPTFEELLEEGSPQALDRAAKMLVQLENKEKRQKTQFEETRSKIGNLSKTTEDLQKKLELLKTNIKNQEEELGLIHKRSEKEIEGAKDFALTKFAKDVIEVSDNLKKSVEMAKKQYPNSTDEFLNKLEKAKEVLFAVLASHDIQEFDPIGEKYDPNKQESMVEVPDPTKPNGTVAMVTQTGYTIKGRLLRSARVCVYRS